MPNYFKLSFKIEGIPELDRILMMKHKELSDFRKPLKKAGRMIKDDVRVNFMTEGMLVGGWKPLAPSTVKGRTREGYGGEHPILQRTGKLKESFYYRSSKTRVIVSSKNPYFKYHQSRRPRTRLPRRSMLVLTERTRQNIVEEFNNYLRFK